MKNAVLLILLAFAAVKANSQNSLTLGVDPLTITMLNGFEVEGAYSFNKNRVAVSYLAGDLPPWFGQMEDFKSSSHSVIDLGFSRWLSEEQKGFSYGISYVYFNEFEVENELGQKLNKNPSKVSLRLSYAWFPFEKVNIFVEPIMNFGFMIGDEDLTFDSGEVFDKVSLIGNGPVLNIGYKFNFNKE